MLRAPLDSPKSHTRGAITKAPRSEANQPAHHEKLLFAMTRAPHWLSRNKSLYGGDDGSDSTKTAPWKQGRVLHQAISSDTTRSGRLFPFFSEMIDNALV